MLKQPYVETEWKVRLFCTAVLKKMIFFTKCRKQPYRVKSTAVSELWFFTSVENSRTFLKKITKYVKYEDTFWLQKSFIAHTTWQIWKPALRYEKKRHIFCRIGRIRLRIAWVTIWSMAHFSRRVSDNSQKKKISKILTNSTKCRTPLPLPKSHSGSKIFFRPNFFLG